MYKTLLTYNCVYFYFINSMHLIFSVFDVLINLYFTCEGSQACYFLWFCINFANSISFLKRNSDLECITVYVK